MGKGWSSLQKSPARPGGPLCMGLLLDRAPPGRGRRTHLHALLPVLRAVQLIVLVTVIVLAVLQEGDLLQHRATQALSAVLAGRVPAQDGGGAGGGGVSPAGSLSPGEP